MYVSLLVNITGQHYAGLSSPHVKDTEGGEEPLEHDHLQRLAVLLELIQVFPSLKCLPLFSEQGTTGDTQVLA